MRSRDAKVITVVCVAVALAFAAFLLAATDGHAVPQVVDLYLVCQYARALAEGHPFQYNPGEPPSTGATSLLQTLLLGGAHAVGIRGEGLVAFAILLGAGLYLATAHLARRVAIAVAGEREGLVAGLLVALGGPVVWGFLYGSDIALFMFLSLWLFDRVLAAWTGRGPGGMALAGSLLALARPEGLPIGVLLGAAWSLGPGRGQRAKASVLAWLPAGVGLALLGLNRALTGLWLGTSVADKSLLANYGLADSLALVTEYAVDVLRGLLLGFYPSQVPVGFARGWASLYFPPLGLLLILLALADTPAALRAPLRLWGLTVTVVAALLTPNVFMGVHFQRHLMWALPTLLVFAAVGLGAAAPHRSCRSPASDSTPPPTA